ncbi:hypothetical protein LTR84_008515 [Exophiala bonariae]|uniref:CHAT domain-containing protein n=1 Tax=Exophiala bonariae TaxID=1690606 RepID=A0AAV9MZI0_9EURO|nr:hypothetical protein LTR84_008515 [Exophiala bonariae]
MSGDTVEIVERENYGCGVAISQLLASSEYADPRALFVRGTVSFEQFLNDGLPSHLLAAQQFLNFALDRPLSDSDLDLEGLIAGKCMQVLVELFQYSRNKDCLIEAMRISDRGLQKLPSESVNPRFMILHTLSLVLEKSYMSGGGLPDLSMAIQRSREAANLANTNLEKIGELNLHMSRTNLSNQLMLKYMEIKISADIKEAIEINQVVYDAFASDTVRRAEASSNLSLKFLRRYLLAEPQELEDLSQSIKLLEESVHLSAQNAPMLPRRIVNLTTCLQMRFQEKGTIADVEAAIRYLRQGLRVVPPSSPLASTLQESLSHFTMILSQPDAARAAFEFSRILNQMARDNKEGGNKTESDSRADESVHCRDILSFLDSPDALVLYWVLLTFCIWAMVAHLTYIGYAAESSNEQTRRLEVSLQDQIERWLESDDQNDLMEAISLVKSSVLNGPDSFLAREKSLVDRRQQLISFASLLSGLVPGPSILKIDIELSLYEASLEIMPISSPEQIDLVNYLANLYLARFRLGGDRNDLDKGLLTTQIGLEQAEPSESRNYLMVTHASMLSMQYEVTNALGDMKQSIDWLCRALCQLPGTSNNNVLRGSILGSLARNLSLYRRDVGFPHIAQEAIILLINALSLPKLSKDSLFQITHTLSALLSNKDNENQETKYLDICLQISEANLEFAPPSHPRRCEALRSLGHKLRSRHRISKKVEDINRAIALTEEAIEIIPKTSVRRSEYLLPLADALEQRADALNSLADNNAAIERFVEAFNNEYTAYQVMRIKAAGNATRMLVREKRYLEASALLAKAVSISSVLASKWTETGDIQRIVGDVNGLPSDAAAMALEAGKSPWEALNLLETGRGIILGASMEMRRDVSKLKSISPQDYEEYELLRDSVADPHAASRGENTGARAAGETAPGRRMQQYQKLEEVMTRIRAIPGLEDFNCLPSEAKLMELVESGPVVTVLSSLYTDHTWAILISRNGIQPLLLEDLTFAALERHVSRLVAAVDYDVFTFFQKGRQVQEVLSWLWDVAVYPILKALGFDLEASKPMIELPRIWWIAAGWVSQLPFHAAGHPGRWNRSTMDHVISSYIPTIKALSYAREQPPLGTGAQNNGVSIVTMKTTPGFQDLAMAEEEAQVISQILTECAVPSTHLQQPNAFKVLDQLKSCQMMHFACHGQSDQEDPLESHLLLEKKDAFGQSQLDRLTVHAIIQAKSSKATLAYLSGCLTANNPVLHQADESLSLSSVFQLAGFRHVIGTYWTSKDEACKEVARGFYTALFDARHAHINPDRRVALAYHMALTEWRKKKPKNPLWWVPFVHIGA